MPASDRYDSLTEPCMVMTCAHEQVIGQCWKKDEHERWHCQAAKPCAIHDKEPLPW